MTIDVQAIRDSFAKAKPIGDQVVAKFYEILFDDNPSIKPLFDTTQMATQEKLLLKSLAFVVDNLENSERLTAYLKHLGERHVGYGTEDEHYEMVGAALLKTFNHFLGEEWTPQLEGSWAAAYGFIVETMKEGAKAVEINSGDEEKTPQVTNIKDAAAPNKPNGNIELPEQLYQRLKLQAKNAVAIEIARVYTELVQEELNKFQNDDATLLALVKKSA